MLLKVSKFAKRRFDGSVLKLYGGNEQAHPMDLFAMSCKFSF